MRGKPPESLAFGKQDREVEQSQRTAPGGLHAVVRVQPHERTAILRAERSSTPGRGMNSQTEDVLVVGDRSSDVGNL